MPYSRVKKKFFSVGTLFEIKIRESRNSFVWKNILLSELFNELHHDLYSAIDSDRTGINAEVVVLGITPNLVAVIFIELGTVLVCAFDELLHSLCSHAGMLFQSKLSLYSVLKICIDEEIHRIKVSENVIRTATDDDTRSLGCKVLHDLGLCQKDLVIWRKMIELVHGAFRRG